MSEVKTPPKILNKNPYTNLLFVRGLNGTGLKVDSFIILQGTEL